ncbi:MAG: LytTR family DNA-binding domain-containing protein [Bacteroidota bacterium]
MNSIIRSIIIDDEANSRENICILLGEFCPLVEVVGEADNIRLAKELILEKRPDLVFLDIQLGSDTAFKLLENLSDIFFEIIFITAHNHYAIKAFEFMAIDYLLKPVEIPQLIRAVNNAADRITDKTSKLSLEQLILQVNDFSRSRHKIALATSRGFEMVYIRDIMYCLANGSYTKFHFTEAEPLLVSKNLKHYENILQVYGFARSHNSALVNLHYVKTVERSQGGALVMEDGETVPVSKNVRQDLENRIRKMQRLI